jgi:tetratricopeptide (TPR) repeat protein
MNFDISHLLESWEYKAGQVSVRKFQGKDGQEKIQLRVDLGLMQMNADGRPDGKRPFGFPSLLEYYQSRLEKYRQEHEGNDEGFKLSIEDCSRLQMEALQYHHRYICFLQLEDYDRVIRDTERNLAMMDFVDAYAENDELAWHVQMLRPQLMMMRTRAWATVMMQGGQFDAAIELVENEIQELRSFYEEMGREDMAEESPEILSLEAWLEDIRERRPMSTREALEQALAEALRKENFEEAAQLRDALRELLD